MWITKRTKLLSNKTSEFDLPSLIHNGLQNQKAWCRDRLPYESVTYHSLCYKLSPMSCPCRRGPPWLTSRLTVVKSHRTMSLIPYGVLWCEYNQNGKRIQLMLNVRRVRLCSRFFYEEKTHAKNVQHQLNALAVSVCSCTYESTNSYPARIARRFTAFH